MNDNKRIKITREQYHELKSKKFLLRNVDYFCVPQWKGIRYGYAGYKYYSYIPLEQISLIEREIEVFKTLSEIKKDKVEQPKKKKI